MAKGGGGNRSAGSRMLSALERAARAEGEYLVGAWTPKGIRGNYRMQKAANAAYTKAYNRSAGNQGFLAQRAPGNFVRNVRAGAKASKRVNRRGWRSYS